MPRKPWDELLTNVKEKLQKAKGIRQFGFDKFISLKALLYGAALFILLLLIVPLGISYTSRPEFCATCHEMQNAYKTWQESSHRKVNCVACHIEPGLLNLFKEKIFTGSKDIYYHFAGTYKKPINAKSRLAKEQITTRVCTQCHSPEKRKFTSSRNVAIDHEIHLKNNVRCTYCHNRVAHKPQPKQKDFLKMTGCFRCHGLRKAARAPGRCSTCHPPDFERKPRSHRATDWAPPSPALVVAGTISQHAKMAKPDLSYCQMCHIEQKLCTPCHETKMPHQRPWGDRHGRTVVAVSNNENSQLFCRRCHELEKFCGKCHKGVIFPHPSPWAPIHGKLAKATNTAPCDTCHRKQFCQWCHREIKMPHIDTWFREHVIFLRDNPIDRCLGCHVKTQCEDCHSKHAVHNQYTLYDFKKPLQ